MNETGSRLGKNYAQALFELAMQSNMTDEVKADLDSISNLYEAERDFRMMLTWPFFSYEKKGESLSRMLGGKVTELTMNFLIIAAKHNRLAFLPQIISGYSEMWEAYRNYHRVKVTTRRALSESEKESLTRHMTAVLDGNVKLETQINPSIIGGIVIRYDDKIIDNSIAKRLESVVRAMMGRGKRRS